MERIQALANQQIVKYAFAGGSAFLTEYGVFLLLFRALEINVYVANSLSFCAGLLVSFLLNRGWAFKAQDFRLRRHHQFALYITLALFNLLMINVIVGVLSGLNISPVFGKICAMIAVVGWNFFIFRLVIFAPKR